MIQGLKKFVSNNLDFYEIIYSGVVPQTKYESKNKPVTLEELNSVLSKKLNER